MLQDEENVEEDRNLKMVILPKQIQHISAGNQLHYISLLSKKYVHNRKMINIRYSLSPDLDVPIGILSTLRMQREWCKRYVESQPKLFTGNGSSFSKYD